MKPDPTSSRLDVAVPDQVRPGSIEWHRLVEDDELRTFLTATHLQGIHQCDVAAALGWTFARAERVRRRLDRKLKQIRGAGVALPYRREMGFDGGNSIRPFYREHFASGRWTWALSHSNISMCPNLSISERQLSRREGFTMSADLQTKLRAERAKLDRVVVASQAVDQTADGLEGKVIDLRNATQADIEMSVIEEREPSRTLAKNLGAAEAELATARRRAAEHTAAVRRQREIVAGVEAEIHAGRHQAFINAIAGPQAALNNALEDFLAASSAVHQVIGEYADVAMDYPMFPDAAGAHGNERALARQLVGLAARLDAIRAAAYLPGFEWKAGAAA